MGARRLGGEGGTVSVVTAAMLVLTLVLSLAAVDLLRVLQARAVAQTAADAAALAAAQDMALRSGEDPAAAAAAYATRNGATLTSCACTPSGNEAVTEVEVVASFILLGPDRPVVARARAVVDTGP